MKIRFERGALVAVAFLVAGLMGAVVIDPLEHATAAPQASLRLMATQLIPPKIVETDSAIADGAGTPAAITDATGIDTLTGVVSVSAVQPHYSARLLRTSNDLTDAFKRMGYDLDLVGTGKAAVPRLFLASLPGDLKDVREVRIRKSLFFKTVLPLILQVNEEILFDRRRLWRLHAERQMGRKLGPVDRLWLLVMAERYGVRRNVIDSLLQRVDVIPPSLALAQAAEESGWGTSRFVREGNAIFGQWTFSESGNLIPARRDDDKFHKIKSFPALIESVRAYARNLNTHRAYSNMRAVRFNRRLKGAPLGGAVMADYLTSYSARGAGYVATIKIIMTANDLQRLDDARLALGRPMRRPII